MAPSASRRGLTLPPSASDTLKNHISGHRFKTKTQTGHLRSAGYWRTFVRDQLGSDDVYLQDEPDARIKADAFALFSAHLFRERGLREKDHAAVRAGVRHFFEEALVDTAFMFMQNPRMAAEATRRSTAEARAHAEANSQRVKLPFPEEVETALRTTLYVDTQWGTWDGSLARTTYVALCWAESHGQRASNFTFPGPKEEDHCLRARDVTFRVQRILDDAREERGPHETFPVHSLPVDLRPEEVVGFTSMVYTHKMGEVRTAQRAKQTNRAHSPEQSALVDLVLEYAQQARLQPDDPFFTVYRSRLPGDKVHRKLLRRKDITNAIKAACETVGLPPERFASSSLRKTNGTKSGLDDDPNAHTVAAFRAGWSTDAGGRSRTMAGHYDYSGTRKRARSSSPRPGSAIPAGRSRVPMGLVLGMLPPPTALAAPAPAAQPRAPSRRPPAKQKKQWFDAVEPHLPRGPRTAPKARS